MEPWVLLGPPCSSSRILARPPKVEAVFRVWSRAFHLGLPRIRFGLSDGEASIDSFLKLAAPWPTKNAGR